MGKVSEIDQKVKCSLTRVPIGPSGRASYPWQLKIKKKEMSRIISPVELRKQLTAKQRLPKGKWYWFIDHNKAFRCMETGHPFDDNNFAESNYFLSNDDVARYRSSMRGRNDLLN